MVNDVIANFRYKGKWLQKKSKKGAAFFARFG